MTLSGRLIRAFSLASLAASSSVPASLSQAAPALGYWACTNGAWHAVGWPNHPKPIRSCGEMITGPATDTKETCEAAGGTWGPIGLFPEPLCVLPTMDGGRYCRDEGECSGSCLADPTKEQNETLWSGKAVVTGGYCSKVSPLVGCLAMVREGTVDGILCID